MVKTYAAKVTDVNCRTKIFLATVLYRILLLKSFGGALFLKNAYGPSSARL